MNANELWDSTYAEKDLRPTDTCRGFAIHFAEAYHRAKVEGMTDEEIEKVFGTFFENSGEYDYAEDLNNANELRQEGAKWLRNKLLNQ